MSYENVHRVVEDLADAAARRAAVLAPDDPEAGHPVVDDPDPTRRATVQLTHDRTSALMEFAASTATRSASMHREAAEAQERLAEQMSDADGAQARKLRLSAQAHRGVAKVDESLAADDRLSEAD